MPVPSFTRDVAAATKASHTSGSMMGSVGSRGAGATRGLGSTTCSPAQSDSYPSSSAKRTRCSPASGSALAWVFSPKIPIRMPSTVRGAGRRAGPPIDPGRDLRCLGRPKRGAPCGYVEPGT